MTCSLCSTVVIVSICIIVSLPIPVILETKIGIIQKNNTTDVKAKLKTAVNQLNRSLEDVGNNRIDNEKIILLRNKNQKLHQQKYGFKPRRRTNAITQSRSFLKGQKHLKLQHSFQLPSGKKTRGLSDPLMFTAQVTTRSPTLMIRRKRSEKEADAGENKVEDDDEYDDYTYDDYLEKAKKRERKFKDVAGSEGPPTDEEVEDISKTKHSKREIEKYLSLIDEYKKKHTPGFVPEKPQPKKESSTSKNNYPQNIDLEGNSGEDYTYEDYLDNHKVEKPGKGQERKSVATRGHNLVENNDHNIANSPSGSKGSIRQRLLDSYFKAQRGHGSFDQGLPAQRLHDKLSLDTKAQGSLGGGIDSYLAQRLHKERLGQSAYHPNVMKNGERSGYNADFKMHGMSDGIRSGLSSDHGGNDERRGINYSKDNYNKVFSMLQKLRSFKPMSEVAKDYKMHRHRRDVKPSISPEVADGQDDYDDVYSSDSKDNYDTEKDLNSNFKRMIVATQRKNANVKDKDMNNLKYGEGFFPLTQNANFKDIQAENFDSDILELKRFSPMQYKLNKLKPKRFDFEDDNVENTYAEEKAAREVLENIKQTGKNKLKRKAQLNDVEMPEEGQSFLRIRRRNALLSSNGDLDSPTAKTAKGTYVLRAKRDIHYNRKQFETDYLSDINDEENNKDSKENFDEIDKSPSDYHKQYLMDTKKEKQRGFHASRYIDDDAQNEVRKAEERVLYQPGHNRKLKEDYAAAYDHMLKLRRYTPMKYKLEKMKANKIAFHNDKIRKTEFDEKAAENYIKSWNAMKHIKQNTTPAWQRIVKTDHTENKVSRKKRYTLSNADESQRSPLANSLARLGEEKIRLENIAKQQGVNLDHKFSDMDVALQQASQIVYGDEKRFATQKEIHAHNALESMKGEEEDRLQGELAEMEFELKDLRNSFRSKRRIRRKEYRLQRFINRALRRNNYRKERPDVKRMRMFMRDYRRWRFRDRRRYRRLLKRLRRRIRRLRRIPVSNKEEWRQRLLMIRYQLEELQRVQDHIFGSNRLIRKMEKKRLRAVVRDLVYPSMPDPAVMSHLTAAHHRLPYAVPYAYDAGAAANVPFDGSHDITFAAGGPDPYLSSYLLTDPYSRHVGGGAQYLGGQQPSPPNQANPWDALPHPYSSQPGFPHGVPNLHHALGDHAAINPYPAPGVPDSVLYPYRGPSLAHGIYRLSNEPWVINPSFGAAASGWGPTADMGHRHGELPRKGRHNRYGSWRHRL